MSEAVLNAQLRSDCGKGAARKLRAEGAIPGTLYGKGIDPVSIKMNLRDVTRAIKKFGTARVFKLVIEGAEKGRKKGPFEKNVMLKEIQTDVIKGAITHIDVHAISLTETITVSIPLTLKGEKENDGGILEQYLREVEIKTLPTDIPESIDVDIDGLKIGNSVHVRDLVVLEGIEIITSGDEAILSISAPRAVVEETEEVEEETVEEAADESAAE